MSILVHSLFSGVPELRSGSENKSGKQVMDKKFLEKVEAVRRYYGFHNYPATFS
jgi:hypothetical protein